VSIDETNEELQNTVVVLNQKIKQTLLDAITLDKA